MIDLSPITPLTLLMFMFQAMIIVGTSVCVYASRKELVMLFSVGRKLVYAGISGFGTLAVRLSGKAG